MISWYWSPNSYLVLGKDSKNPCLLFPGKTTIVNSLNYEFDDLKTDTDLSKCTGHTSLSFLRPRISSKMPPRSVNIACMMNSV